MTGFIKVKRVYVKKADKTKKLYNQTVTVAVAAIATVRASNRLGFPQHRSTITLMSGDQIDLADEAKAVNKALKA